MLLTDCREADEYHKDLTVSSPCYFENIYRVVLVLQVTELVTSSVLFELKLSTRKNNKVMSKYVWNHRIYWK